MDFLKQNADRLLHEYGLLDILKEYGTPHVIGSVSMDLIAWPDLDQGITDIDTFLSRYRRSH